MSVKLSDFAEGAVDERFNIELEKVLESFSDLNTDPAKVRKIQLTISLKGDKTRKLSTVSVQAKTTLPPSEDIETTLLLDYDDGGKLVANELKSGIPGQMFVSADGEVLDDKGKPVLDNEKTDKVINFK